MEDSWLFTILVTTVHEIHVAMNFIYVRLKSYTSFLLHLVAWISIWSTKNFVLLHCNRVQVVNILSHKAGIEIICFNTMGLKAGNWLVSIVWNLALFDSKEIMMPLPISHWVLIKEWQSTDLSWLSLICIPLCFFPEAILASECWDATSCWYTSSS